jgi:hypothetical protein
MFRPLTDARYWFQWGQQAALAANMPRKPGQITRKAPAFAPYGALILADGTTVELDYMNRADQLKLSGLQPDQVAGIGWRDRTTGEWRVTVSGNLRPIHEGWAPTLAEATERALEARFEVEAAETALRDNPAAILERELARHDWWHMMSDSYGTTLAGQRHMVEIKSIAAQLPAEKVRALWAVHAPADFACPV